MKKLLVVVVFCMLLPATMVLAQKTDGVHLFQNFFSDAVVAQNPYGDGRATQRIAQVLRQEL